MIGYKIDKYEAFLKRKGLTHHIINILRLLNPNSTEALLVTEGILTPASGKILDTSVIIDGRIEGLLKCGLLEGQVIVAQTKLMINEIFLIMKGKNDYESFNKRNNFNEKNWLTRYVLWEIDLINILGFGFEIDPQFHNDELNNKFQNIQISKS